MIQSNYATFLFKMEKKSLILNDKEKAIESILINHNNNKSLSFPKIAQLYSEISDDKISRVSVYRILKKIRL